MPARSARLEHEQVAMRGSIVVAQRSGEGPVQEIGPVGQTGQGIEVGFAAHLFEAGGFLGEHGFQAVRPWGSWRRRRSSAPRCFRLGDADERRSLIGSRLLDDGIELPLDPAKKFGCRAGP